MLPDKTRKGKGWEPSLLMRLGAWSDTPALSKILRLREHIQWAADHGCLDQIFSFLQDIPDDQWHQYWRLAIAISHASGLTLRFKTSLFFKTVGPTLWVCCPLKLINISASQVTISSHEGGSDLQLCGVRWVVLTTTIAVTPGTLPAEWRCALVAASAESRVPN